MSAFTAGRPFALLNTALLLLALLLFALFVYEPVSFSRSTPHFVASAGGHRDLTVHLRPEDHQHRENTTTHLDWTVTKGYRYPDGVGKWVYLVNGQFPCPNIEARSGDTLVIDLHNQLDDEGLAIHFHGLRMEGANHMDGVVGVSQTAVPPGSTFTYEFQISPNQAGTFWWHAHAGFLRADGLFGALVVHPHVGEDAELSRQGSVLYEDDMLLMVGDWYHLPSPEVQKSYDTWSFWGQEPSPDSLLVNGQGAFNCSKAPNGRVTDCVSVSRPELVPRASRSRLRVVNVGSMSGFSIRVPGNRITVLAVDGGNLVEAQEHPYAEVGVLHPGERVDLVVDWGSTPSDDTTVSSFEIILDREYFRRKNYALDKEQEFPVKLRNDLVRRETDDMPDLEDSKYDLTTARGQTLPLGALGNEEPHQNLVVYTKIELLAHLENRPKGYINHTYWIPQETPLIDLPRAQWDEHQLVPFVGMSDEQDTWVDIVINNVDELGHPFHLHGYEFYVISLYHPQHRLGWHAYNPFDNKAPPGGAYNLINPVKKDSVYIPAAGYAVLRIKADNPGIWLLHCHILWHQGVGMAMALEVGKNVPVT